MTISARPTGFFADFRRLRILLLFSGAAALAAPVLPTAAEAGKVRRAVSGGYDGVWNVLIITQAGNCDAAYSYPFRVAAGRISSAGAANVSGSVGRGGGVAVRISAGGSVATGSGRLAGNSGAGRWSARLSGGNCSGHWQATRS
ncbi:MAG TPA: hypothetical protein VJV58_17660 [Bradyrhizobium sp.]|uniref:hypothetical protein n=1 Tax=Bradyrhizobium sp. TaxID=376 RepID=UPI002B49875E|nr:hypothetical protein [Bradyrhizobium sp.]HKO72756.1 hypothetical protein [Bradyrhizobium sp.]